MNRAAIPLILIILIAGGCRGSAPQTHEDTHEDHSGHDHSSVEAAGHEGHEHGVDESDSHEGEAISLTSEQFEAAEIETVEVRMVNVPDGLTAPGIISIISGRSASVTPPAEGVLTMINVALGQKVVRGQVIGALESSSLAEAYSRITEAEQALAEARAKAKDDEGQIKLAENSVAASAQTLKRQKELASAGAFSQAPLQAAQSELSQAESELLSLQKEEASHSDQLRRLESLYKEGLIGRLELEAARLEVQQDVIKLERARARVATARAAFKREESIAAKGLLNSREVQAAEADLQTAKLELAKAKSQLASSQGRMGIAEKGLANARGFYRSASSGTGVSGGRAILKAPLSGVVTQLEAARGQAVDRTQPLLLIEDSSQVWATVSVAEKDAPRLKIGLTARVSSKALAGRAYQGPVQVIGSRLDPKTRTLPVQILLQNPRGDLKPGMFVEAFLDLGGAEKALMIPKSALAGDGGKKIVFVKEAEGFVRHEVRVGREAGDQVQIISGLKEGDRVVSKGSFILKSQAQKEDLKGHEH